MLLLLVTVCFSISGRKAAPSSVLPSPAANRQQLPATTPKPIQSTNTRDNDLPSGLATLTVDENSNNIQPLPSVSTPLKQPVPSPHYPEPSPLSAPLQTPIKPITSIPASSPMSPTITFKDDAQNSYNTADTPQTVQKTNNTIRHLKVNRSPAAAPAQPTSNHHKTFSPLVESAAENLNENGDDFSLPATAASASTPSKSATTVPVSAPPSANNTDIGVDNATSQLEQPPDNAEPTTVAEQPAQGVVAPEGCKSNKLSKC